MPDVTLTTVGPAWALLAAVLLLAVTLGRRGLDGVLAARAAGRPWAGGRPRPCARRPACSGSGAGRPSPPTSSSGGRRRRASCSSRSCSWSAVVPARAGGRSPTSPSGSSGSTRSTSSVWAFVWLLGWGPNAAHSLVGGYRFLAQALGYELPLMFALIAPAVAAGSLRLGDVAAAQHGLWYVVWMPVAFAVYCLGVLALLRVGAVRRPGRRRHRRRRARRGLRRRPARSSSPVGTTLLVGRGARSRSPSSSAGARARSCPAGLWVVAQDGCSLPPALVLAPATAPRAAPGPVPRARVGSSCFPWSLLQDLVVAVVAVWRG